MNETVVRRPGYVKLKLDSGENILLSAGRRGLGIYRLSLWGMIPLGTVWKRTRRDTGALNAAIQHFTAAESAGSGSVAQRMADVISHNCHSIEDVREYCARVPSAALVQ